MQSVNSPIGGLDRQTDLHLVAPEDYRDALNIRNNRGAVSPMMGNELVNVPNITIGAKEFIGAVEDPINRRSLFFLWSVINNHSIVEYKNGVARVLGRPINALGLQAGRLIHSAKIVDGDTLYWPDAEVLPSGQISGSAPKKISTARLDVSKPLSHVVNFELSAFTVGNPITYEVFNLLTSVSTIPFQTIYTVLPGDSQANVIASVIAAIQALGSSVSFVTGDLFFEASHPGDGQYLLFTGGVHAIPTNFYRLGLTAEEIGLGRPFPKSAPIPTYEKATGVAGNRVQKPFQFRFRYQFWDGGYSAWSPVSYVPTNFRTENNTEIGGGVFSNDPEYNRINIQINDDLLNQPSWRSLISGIDVAYKNYDTGIWRFSERNIPIRRFLLAPISIKFLGVGESLAVPSDDASAPDAQALKNFDFAPRLALSHEISHDRQGSVYGLWGGVLQGYNIPRVRATLSVQQKVMLSPTSPGTQASLNKTLKSGGRYKVGIVYENFLHQSPVVPLGQVDVPFAQNFNAFGENGYYLRVQLLSTPPTWATHYRLVITRNLNQSQYVQVPFTITQLWIINTQLNTATQTGNPTTATHIGLSASRKLVEEANDRNILFDLKEHSDRLFIPTRGDRVQVVSWGENPNLLTTNIPGYNHEVAGYSLTWPATSDIDRFTVFIKNAPGLNRYLLPPPTGPVNYLLGEIYRQQEIESGLYYEIGGAYLIAAGTHSTNPVNLDTVGDAYSKHLRFYHTTDQDVQAAFTIGSVHVDELHPWEVEGQSDHGRPQIEDPNYKETFDYDVVRATDAYISNSIINGLSSFRGADYIRINRENGEVGKLVLVDSVLLAVCRVRSQPIYVNKSQLLDLSGNSLVGRSSELLTIADELKFDLGTQNPATIIYEDGAVYGWDALKGAAWRYSVGAGQFPISDYKMADHFSARSKLLHKNGLLEGAIGGYQREFGVYYLVLKGAAIENVVTVPAETWSFEEQRKGNQGNKWICRHSMSPSVMINVMSEFFTATTQLFRHEVGYQQYQAAYDCYIEIGVNPNPEFVKNFYRVMIEAATKWNCSSIVIPPTAGYPDGMESTLTGARLEKYEGQWMGDFLRDLTDRRFASLDEPERTARALLQGRPLRGEVMRILLRPEVVGSTELRKIIVTFEPSKPI